MRHIYKSFILLLAIVLLSSCEKVIDFDTQSQNEKGIAVYALAIPGKQFTARLSRSFTVNENPQAIFSPAGNDYGEVLDSIFYSQVVIKDASAEILVNGVEQYNLYYRDEDPFYYTCDYVPKAGDKISLTIKAKGYDDVSATVTVENPQPVEIVKTEVVFKDNGIDMPDEFADQIPDYGAASSSFSENPFDQYGMDSVMLITLRFNDPGAQRNFYRLKVRAIADRKRRIMGDNYRYFYSVSEIFSSSDVVFIDNLLVKPFSGWDAGFSNVFDDHLFDGTSHTFTVETRKRYGENPRVDVELQTISQDLYYFLKSYQLFRMSTDDVYMTPIGLHSNIANGWGIFGTLSYDRHIIFY